MGILFRTSATLLLTLGLVGIGASSTIAQTEDQDAAPTNQGQEETAASEAAEGDAELQSEQDQDASIQQQQPQQDVGQQPGQGVPDQPGQAEADRATDDAGLDERAGRPEASDQRADADDQARSADEFRGETPDAEQREATADAQRSEQAREGQLSSSDTPPVPQEARQAALGERGQREFDRNARWRMQRHNGEWWFYSTDDQWMYHRDGDWRRYRTGSFQPLAQTERRAGPAVDRYSDDVQRGAPYATGYRGDEYASRQGRFGRQAAPPPQRLRYDRYGRPYICENGRAVYVNVEQPGYRGDRPEPTRADQPRSERTRRSSAYRGESSSSSVLRGSDAPAGDQPGEVRQQDRQRQGSDFGQPGEETPSTGERGEQQQEATPPEPTDA